METFLNFLVKYWQYISVALVVIFEFILMVIKKKPQVFDNSLTADLVELIKIAEERFGEGHGVDKLSYVVEEASKKHSSIPPQVISFFVDSILNTPTKKGGLGREQVE